VNEEEARQPETSAQWQRIDLAVVGLFFVASLFLVPGGTFLVLRFFRPDLHSDNLPGVIEISLQALLDFALVGFILFLIKVVHGWSVRESMCWKGTGNFTKGYLIAAGAAMSLAVLFVSVFLPTPEDSGLDKLLSTTPSIVAFVVFGIAIAPFMEEVLFRGFLFAALLDVYNVRVAVVLTTLLFGALHLVQLQGNWPAAILILIVGYVFTRVRQHTGSLVPSIIMHTAYNAMIFGIQALSTLLTRAFGA